LAPDFAIAGIEFGVSLFHEETHTSTPRSMASSPRYLPQSHAPM